LSKRQRFAKFLQRSGALRFVLALRAHVSAPWLSILTYHRFADLSGHESFDDGVVDVTLEEFNQHVASLKRHFNIVGIDEICALAAGKRLARNAVAITFDDGYLDCYAHALPILERHGCKAIFFVPTAFISERRIPWWDRVAYVIKHAPRNHIALEYPLRIELLLRGNRSPLVARLLRLIKNHHPLDLDRFLDELSDAAGVAWTRDLERASAERLLMTWDQVRALRTAGMDVQSHSRTHRILQTLSPEELDDELRGSRVDLERELGEPPRALAYPVGDPLKSNSPIRTALVKSGYEIGFTNGTGPTPLWGRFDPFNVCRQTVSRDLSAHYLLSIAALPMLAPKHPWHLSTR
jgi:peptidoglycan/xylan/chitin deacetylase (PgdA/CDA1 family)